MIQIKAAARLKVMAKADEAMAREYFKSFGVTVGKLWWSSTGSIDFQIDQDKATKAKSVLTKKFGKPVIESTPGASIESMYFPIDDDRSVYLEIRQSGPSMLGLTDSADR